MLADLLDDLFDEPLALDTSLPHVPPQAADANGFLSSESSSLDDEVDEETPPTSFSNQHTDRAPAVAQKRRAPSWTVRAKSSLLGSFAPSLTSSVHENIAAGESAGGKRPRVGPLPATINSIARPLRGVHMARATPTGGAPAAPMAIAQPMAMSFAVAQALPNAPVMPPPTPPFSPPPTGGEETAPPTGIQKAASALRARLELHESTASSLLQDRRLQGCAVAASYALAAHFSKHMQMTPWFHHGALLAVASVVLLAIFGLRICVRAFCCMVIAFPVVTLCSRAILLSPREITEGLQTTVQAADGLLAVSVCVGAWLGSQPDHILTTRMKLLTLAGQLTLRLCGLGTMAARTGNPWLVALVGLYADLPYWCSFILAAKLAHSASCRASLSWVHPE